MKLVAGLRVPCYRPYTAVDRRHFLLDAQNCSDATLTTFDVFYQRRPTGIETDDEGNVIQNWLVPCQHWQIMPRSCAMSPRGPHCRLEGNIALLRGRICQCWSWLTVNICFVISHSALPKNSNKLNPAFCLTEYRPTQTNNSHTFNFTRNMIQFYLATILFSHFKIVQNV